MKKTNASQFPSVFYGLHMREGLVGYKEDGEIAYIKNDTILKMSPSLVGKPLIVRHPGVDITPEDEELFDGYVVEAFFNKHDGNHWVKFIAVSDEAHKKIEQGWTLSNGYFHSRDETPGQHQGVDYDYEINGGEFEHMALVQNPRYEQSIILTPDEFKEYNLNKEAEIKKLTNEKKEIEMKFFKKSKVEKLENEKEIGELSVLLPKTKKEKTINELIEIADVVEEAPSEEGKEVSVKDYVIIEGEKVTIEQLLKTIEELSEDKEVEKVEEIVENEIDEEDKKEDKKTNSIKSDYFSKLKNASKKQNGTDEITEVVVNLAPSELGKKLF